MALLALRAATPFRRRGRPADGSDLELASDLEIASDLELASDLAIFGSNQSRSHAVTNLVAKLPWGSLATLSYPRLLLLRSKKSRCVDLLRAARPNCQLRKRARFSPLCRQLVV